MSGAINLLAYARSAPISLIDALGLTPSDDEEFYNVLHAAGTECSPSEQGDTCKAQILDTRLFWANSPVHPGIVDGGVDLVDAIEGALDIYGKLPDPVKPPLGVSPGVGEAGGALKDQALGLYSDVEKTQGVRIWVELVCNECRCEESWIPFWGEDQWVWRRMEPVWHRCTLTGDKIGVNKGFDVTTVTTETGRSKIAAAVPKCWEEAWSKGSCHESTNPRALDNKFLPDAGR